MPKATKTELAAVVRKDFKAFVRFAFRLVQPDTEFLDNFHIDAICHELERVRAGDSKRLTINLPPRTLKSFIVSVAFPAYILGHDPSQRFIVVSHNDALANDLAAQFRKLVAHPQFKDIFPTLSPAPTKDTQQVYKTEKGGGRRAVTPQTGVTGLGADYLIFDDPISAEDAAKQSRCEKVADWINKTAMTRFNNAATGVALLVMQRLSIWDPHALVAEPAGWRTLCLPAIADQALKIATGPNTKHEWRKGELLHPERLPTTYLDEQRSGMGLATFQAQFLQTPVPGSGGLIDVTKFKVFNKMPDRPPDTVLMSVDPAAGGPYAKSYSVILVFYVFDGHLYLFARWRRKVEFAELKAATLNHIKKYNPDELVVENASTGSPLISELGQFLHTQRVEYSNPVPRLHPFKPTDSKEARWDEASLLVSQGRFHIGNPKKYDWVQSFVDECRAFPEGNNDDQVDAFTQALIAYHRLYDQAQKTKVTFFTVGG